MNTQCKQYISSLNLGTLKSKLVWSDASLKSTELMTRLKHHYTGEKAETPFNDDCAISMTETAIFDK